MSRSLWQAIVDAIVVEHVALGLALTGADVAVWSGAGERRDVALLIVRTNPAVAAVLREERDRWEPVVLAACRTFGLVVEGVAWVDSMPEPWRLGMVPA